MDLESVDLVLGTTRSVRRKLDFARPVEPDTLEACIALATQAPTGRNAQAWRFLVLTEPEKKRAVAELYRRAFAHYRELRAADPQAEPPRRAYQELADRMHEMPALILVCVEGRPEALSVAQQVAFYGSVLPAAWSLMLALRSRGLGSTWTTLHLLHEEEAARVLGIPEGVTQTVLLPVGYLRDAVLRPAQRLGPAEVTYWNEWGVKRPR
ncbi:MAG TPA: nitroreductase family protein [Myxococcota bacterium]|nr:nitroreductase family protein [Myxococcota bacterium]